MPKAANSWSNAKYATFGNTAFAWASSRKPNSLQRPTTTANSANQSVTKICSSVSLSLAPYRQRPDPLLSRRLAKKARESSTHSRNTTSRHSRSHSPTHLLKPPKRRNTMNSRDAAFDESLKEIIEATAAEAAAATDPPKPAVNGCTSGQSEVPDDDSNGRKKRKRGEDDACVQPANSRSNYSLHPSAVSPRSVPDQRRVHQTVPMQPPALCRKSSHHPPNALQAGNREILAFDEVVHARPSLRITMLSLPSRVTKVCIRANPGLLTHVTLTQGPARASDRPKRPAASLVLRQNARLCPLTRQVASASLRIARASEIIPGQE
jgi:hypothetical protein